MSRGRRGDAEAVEGVIGQRARQRGRALAHAEELLRTSLVDLDKPERSSFGTDVIGRLCKEVR